MVQRGMERCEQSDDTVLYMFELLESPSFLCVLRDALGWCVLPTYHSPLYWICKSQSPRQELIQEIRSLRDEEEGSEGRACELLFFHNSVRSVMGLLGSH